MGAGEGSRYCEMTLRFHKKLFYEKVDCTLLLGHHWLTVSKGEHSCCFQLSIRDIENIINTWSTLLHSLLNVPGRVLFPYNPARFLKGDPTRYTQLNLEIKLSVRNHFQ